MTTTLDREWNNPLTALTGGEHLNWLEVGGDLQGAYLDCDSGDQGYHVVGFRESLGFAKDCGHIPAEYTDDDGTLTNAGRQQAQTAIRAILAEHSILPPETVAAVTVEDLDGDEDPAIAVYFSVDTDSSMTVQQAHDKLMWPFWAAMTNMTDPGTFGWPYLWSNL